MKRLHSLIAILAVAHAGVPCYNPDSSIDNRDKFFTCYNLGGAPSMCCADSDECLWNGLCKVSADVGGTDNATYWRNTCSRSGWPQVGCLDKCTNEGDGGSYTGNTLMTPCDGTDYSETWCCGDDTLCCGSGNEIHVPKNIYPAEPKSAIFTSSSSASTSPNTSTSSSDPQSSSGSNAGLSTGAKAGIGVGVGVGGCAIIALLAFFFLRRRRRADNAAAAVPATAAVPTSVAPATNVGMGQKPQELELAHAHEKPADSTYELPGEPSR